MLGDEVDHLGMALDAVVRERPGTAFSDAGLDRVGDVEGALARAALRRSPAGAGGLVAAAVVDGAGTRVYGLHCYPLLQEWDTPRPGATLASGHPVLF